MNLNFSTIHLPPTHPINSAFCQKPASLILIVPVNIDKGGGANEKKLCLSTEETIPHCRTGRQHSDFISLNVTSASGKVAHGDKTLLRHILFSSHYTGISKNIQNATQIRCGVRLQNILFMVGNGNLAADEEFVVWQVPSPRGRSLCLETPQGFPRGYTSLERTLPISSQP